MCVGAEGLQCVVKSDFAAVVTPEMQCRVPAAGHGDEIAVDFFLGDDAALSPAIGGDFHGCYRVTSFDGGDDAAEIDVDACVFRAGD